MEATQAKVVQFPQDRDSRAQGNWSQSMVTEVEKAIHNFVTLPKDEKCPTCHQNLTLRAGVALWETNGSVQCQLMWICESGEHNPQVLNFEIGSDVAPGKRMDHIHSLVDKHRTKK